MARLISILAVSAMQYMKIYRYRSDGLGGHFGLSCSPRLGVKKRVTRHYKDILLYNMILFFLCRPLSCQVDVLNMTLDMQRCNELYRLIKFPYICRPNIAKNRLLCQCIFLTLFIVDIVLWFSIVLLLSGDIEINPGPDSVEGSFSSCDTLSATSFETLSNHLSIFHLNIQSIVPKIDIIRSGADAFDVLVFSESWLKPFITDDTIQIENFKPPFRKDRVDRIGGGVALYVRDTIPCKRRTDLELRDLESVWVELQVKCKRILVGGFYKPPNSSPDYFELLKESIDRACNTDIIDIIITGDFNCIMAQSIPNKMRELMSEYNLSQLISDDTHFTEHSSSLLDLILVRNKENI